jgi:hypothetical protein
MMTRLLLLAAAAALVPIALEAATPPSQTSRGVGEPRGNAPSSGARAAAPSSRGSSGASLGGAPIPGLCMLSQSAVLSNELLAEQTSINNDAKLLEGQRANLAAADVQARLAALQTRANALQQKSQLRQRELAATRQKALNRISSEAQPVIVQAFRAHDCSLLIDRNTVLLGNMSGDITADVSRGLDARITTITFERERLAQ